MKQIQARITEEQKKKIDDIAEERDTSVARMIRQWINGLKRKGG